MGRLIGPALAERTFLISSGSQLGEFVPAGTHVPLYVDEACTQAADVLAADGSALPTSGGIPYVTIGDDLFATQFLFPDVTDPVVYTRLYDGGPVNTLHPDADALLDSLRTAQVALTDFVSRRPSIPRIMTLIAGTEDETLAQANCVISADTVNTRVGGRAWQMTMSGAAAAYMLMSPVSPATSGLLAFPPAQAVCAWVYLPDASKVNYITIELSLNSGNSVLWSRDTAAAPAHTLVNGWNLIRFKTASGLAALSTWGNLNRVRVYVVTNAATTATIDHVWLECPEKARLLFVSDAARKSLRTYGVPRLRAAGVPVTWGVDITLLGTFAGTGDYREFLTEADIAELAAEGDSISFHSWDGSATSAMTAAQLRAETAKCIKWLQARGYTGRMWRAAYVQNNAANYTAVNDLLLGQAISSVPSTLVGTWPPIDFNNMERFSFYRRPFSEIDAHFDLLRRTHGLSITYNHGIWPTAASQDPAYDATPEEFDYWMTKVETAIDEGWLEAVTFEQLWYESGGDFSWHRGDPAARWTDAAGNAVVKRML